MSVQKVEARDGGAMGGHPFSVFAWVDGPGTYACLPWEDWVEVLAWAEDDTGLPWKLAERLGLIEKDEQSDG